MKRYAVYLRVSTEEQRDKGYSLEAMKSKCIHHIKAQENSALYKVYEDGGYSGSVPPHKRPAMARMIEDVDNYNVVLVWKLDRLSRNLRETLNLEYMLRKCHVKLESVTEKIDTGTSSGKMFFNMIASFAEFERDLIAERTWNAMASVVGTKHLGGYAPFGYRKKGNRLYVVESEAVVVKKVFSRYLKTRNLSDVARYLNRSATPANIGNIRWGYRRIARMLRNPVYTGSVAWNKSGNRPDKWIIAEERHPAIIQATVFKRVQKIINC